MAKPRRWLRAACLGLALGGCAESHADSRVLVEVHRGPLEFHGHFYGELLARKSEKIHAPDLSTIDLLTVDTVPPDGTVVVPGDVVLTFVDDDLLLDLRAKESELAVQEASMRREAERLERDRIELELAVRRQELAVERAKLYVIEGVNFVSGVELEKAKLDVARAEVELADANKKLQSFARARAATLQVEQLKVTSARDEVLRRRGDVDKMVVKAPSAGVLYAPYTRLNWARTKVEPGRVARSGDLLLELPDLSAFDLQVAVRQKDATLVRVGDTAKVYPAARPDVELLGKVTLKDNFATTRNERLGTSGVEGTLKELLVTVQLETSPDFLRPGGTARVELSSRAADDVLRVPLTALREQRDADGKVGYLAELASGEQRAVSIGRSTNAHAEVLAGLSEGDQVVLGPKEPEAE